MNRRKLRSWTLRVHLTGIAAWVLASGALLALSLAGEYLAAWDVYRIVVMPAAMIGMVTGIALIAIARGGIVRRQWFRLKLLLVAASMVLANLWLPDVLRQEPEGSPAVAAAVYAALLLAVLGLSIKKPSLRRNAVKSESARDSAN